MCNNCWPKSSATFLFFPRSFVCDVEVSEEHLDCARVEDGGGENGSLTTESLSISCCDRDSSIKISYYAVGKFPEERRSVN